MELLNTEEKDDSRKSVIGRVATAVSVGWERIVTSRVELVRSIELHVDSPPIGQEEPEVHQI